MRRILRPFLQQVRFYARASNIVANNSLKPVRVTIKSSKPKSNAYDVELGLKQSLVLDFVEKRSTERHEGDFNEDDYLHVINNAETYNSQHKMEERMYRSMIRRKTIERAYFKKPKEPCLLSWAARDQIYYLHNLDPDEWTPERLSESFPISLTGVKKLLKSCKSIRYGTNERKKRNDALVTENWKLLMAGKLKDVKPELLQLQKEGNLSPSLSLANKHFPLPKEAPKPIEKPIGEFLAIIKPYLNKPKPELASVDESKMITVQESHQTNESSMRANEMSFKSLKNLSNLVDFKANNERKWSNTLTTMKNVDETHTTEICEETLLKKKSKYNAPLELTIDSDNAYVYSSNTGYQHPMGKNLIWRDKINIPKLKFKKGAIYKVDNSFYSDDGEFLYRIP